MRQLFTSVEGMAGKKRVGRLQCNLSFAGAIRQELMRARDAGDGVMVGGKDTQRSRLSRHVESGD